MTDSARPDTSSDRAGGSDPATPYRYSASLAADIESRWQGRWETEHTFEAPNPSGLLADPEKVAARPKRFVLDMFPYPSGIGLHALGYDVLHRVPCPVAASPKIPRLGFNLVGG